MRYRNPKVALFFSLLLAGLGQFYNGQLWKGLVFLSGAILSLTVSLLGAVKVLSEALRGSSQEFFLDLFLVLGGLLSFIIFSGLSVWDAFRSAKKINALRS